MEHNVLEQYLVLVVSYAAPLVEACAVVVILSGVVRALLLHAHCRFRLDQECLTSLRSVLVQSLVMGLEFQLAADVLRTASNPDTEHLIVLAVLIGLRIALGFVLERELHTVCERPVQHG